MIISIVIILTILWLFYYLFIEGNIWPILFFIFGVFGGKVLILNYFPTSNAIIMTFAGYSICYATFIAIIISILAIGTIIEK